MKKFIYRLSCIFLFSVLFAGISYANNIAHQNSEKTYILRVTSKDPNRVVKFSGSYMKFSNTEGTGTWQLNMENTPFETTLKANFIGAMFSSIEAPITVSILERDKSGEHFILSGTGLFTFAHTDDVNSFVTGSGGDGSDK